MYLPSNTVLVGILLSVSYCLTGMDTVAGVHLEKLPSGDESWWLKSLGGGGASLVLLPHFMQCKFQGGGGESPFAPPPPPPPHTHTHPHPKQSPELDGQSIGIILSQWPY